MKSKFDTLADKLISEGIFGGTSLQQVQTVNEPKAKDKKQPDINKTPYVDKEFDKFMKSEIERQKHIPGQQDGKIADIKKICGNEGCDDAKAMQILKLMRGTKGSVVEGNLEQINDLVKGYGVESIKVDDGGVGGYWMDAIGAYVNMGDTYAPTVVFDARNDQWLITSWGDIVEDYETNKNDETEEDEEEDDTLDNDDVEKFFIMEKPMVVRKFMADEADKVKGEVERIYGNVINMGFTREDVAKLYAVAENAELMIGIHALPTVDTGKITGDVFMAIGDKYMLGNRKEIINDDVQNLKDMIDEDLTGYDLERDGDEVARA
jgi:hypothetical protein